MNKDQHQQPCPCAWCRTEEINAELFDIPETLSPKILWMEKHGIQTRVYSDGNCYAFNQHDSAWGETGEDEAITQLALKLGVKLWNEEGLK